MAYSNTGRGVAECSMKNFEFILQLASAFIFRYITNYKPLILFIFKLSVLH